MKLLWAAKHFVGDLMIKRQLFSAIDHYAVHSPWGPHPAHPGGSPAAHPVSPSSSGVIRDPGHPASSGSGVIRSGVIRRRHPSVIRVGHM
nr:hypothetical protein [uncultured Desulfobacter sp.]